MLAMILGVAIVATIGGSFAFAQTAGSTSGQSSTGTAPPQIQGSVNLPQMILSSVKTSFTTAATTAASAPGITNGQVISGGLKTIQGSVVYSFKVTDGTNVYSVIVDAGTGSILHTSAGHPITLGSLLGMGGHGMMGQHHMGMGGGAWKLPQSSTAPSTSSPPATGTQ